MTHKSEILDISLSSLLRKYEDSKIDFEKQVSRMVKDKSDMQLDLKRMVLVVEGCDHRSRLN